MNIEINYLCIQNLEAAKRPKLTLRNTQGRATGKNVMEGDHFSVTNNVAIKKLIFGAII